MNLQRRRLVLASAGLWGGYASGFPICTEAKNQICNGSRLYSVDDSGVVQVQAIEEMLGAQRLSNAMWHRYHI